MITPFNFDGTGSVCTAIFHAHEHRDRLKSKISHYYRPSISGASPIGHSEIWTLGQDCAATNGFF